MKLNFRRGDIAPATTTVSAARAGTGTVGYASPGLANVAAVPPIPRGGTVIGVAPPSELPLAMQETLPQPIDRAAETADLPAAGVRSTVLPKIVLADGAGAPSLRATDKPRYSERNTLGSGGIGDVTLARDEDIGRDVAIKRLRGQGDAAGLMRFVDEVQVLGQLDHPNIVPVHDVGCDQHGRLYFVMKRLEGDTLEAIIERLRDGDPATHQRYPLAVRTEIFMGVLRAVQFAHARGIIHRDIKPSNVMVGRFGEVAVVDWGIAKRLDDPVSDALDRAAPPPDEDAPDARRPFRTRVGTLLGTPAYMSPEQARGDNHLLDVRTDIFSLCVVFYELLTLQHPFGDGETLPEILDAVRTKTPKMPAALKVPRQSGVSVELSNVIMRGLAKQREHRHASVGEMIEELHAVADGSFAITCPVTFTKGVLLWAGRFVDAHPMAIGLGVPLAAVGCVVALVGLVVRLVVS